jgi:CubicO group peptidase (beta-lactamase class C family)
MKRLTLAILFLVNLALPASTALAEGFSRMEDFAPTTSVLPTENAGLWAPAAQAESGDLNDPEDVEAFLDGFFASALPSHHIPGAVIVLVKDGTLVFSKGYGYADIERGLPVDPQRTLFRVGSVSKLFVWTSVMQLKEKGLLNLDEDIRSLLDVRLPYSCSQPITLSHLMSHTAGFEDSVINLWARSPGDLIPLDEYLRQNPPECIDPAGEVPAYSNYGTALAAYLVERISGLSFAEYADENIFTPLGMAQSTFRQPLPPVLDKNLAQGYAFANGGYIPGDFELGHLYPAGALSTTAEDMAYFMIAHLQNGEYQNNRILKETTTRLMHTQHFTFDARSRGWAHGFMEMEVNGQKMIGHGGDTFLFHTLLALIPEQNLGLFVSFNAAGGVYARDELLQAFMTRYFPPAPAPPDSMLEDSPARLEHIVGEYYASRRNESGFEKIFRLLQPVWFSRSPDGYLNLRIANTEQSQWVEIEPYVFQNRFGSDQLYFQQDQNGRITAAVLSKYPWVVAYRTPWYASLVFSRLLLLGAGLAGLTVLIGWPWTYLAARSQGNSRGREVRWMERLARWIAYGFFLAAFVFLAGVLIALSPVNPAYQVPELLLGRPAWFSFLFWLPWIMALLAFGMVIFAVMAWTGSGSSLGRPYWGLAGRIHYSLLAFSAVGLVWFCNFWNLMR